MTSQQRVFKDDGLVSLANVANVAQFVSFGPGSEPSPRHSRVRGYGPDAPFPDLETAITAVLSTSFSGAVNVRTYRPDDAKNKAFIYGVKGASEAADVVRSHAAQGMFTIVNETIDVNDGGVSGVLLGQVAEFAPGDTPRCVDKPGTAAIPRAWVADLFRTVYGFTPDLDYEPEDRIEFSLHPHRVGLRSEHTVIWEIEHVGSTAVEASVDWPNKFSRHIGDKAYGLLVAHLLGLAVPKTQVISRTVAPFSFGKDSGSSEMWTRTCPTEQVPGKYTTVRGWVDPFALLAREDPDGNRIASILAQQQVDAAFSGATRPEPGNTRVEGRKGFGDDFMAGAATPEDLPANVTFDVEAAVTQATAGLDGAVRVEWVHDGNRVWIVQLHRAHGPASVGRTIYPGEVEAWRTFIPVTEGPENLGRLRSLIEDARATGEGILIAGDVGVTSHVGDLLRRAEVPARIEDVAEV